MGITKFGALILYSENLEAMVGFYTHLGLTLGREQHDDGPVHYTCELEGLHFSIYESESGRPPMQRTSGASIVGWEVTSMADAIQVIENLDLRILQPPVDKPWGKRMLV